LASKQIQAAVLAAPDLIVSYTTMIKPRRRIETKPRRRIEVPKMAASKAWGDDGDAVCDGADVGAAGADDRGGRRPCC
jgi:hypothetical protein